ncbi:MAG TPA: hypothetical protein VFT46_11270 [Holophagaceae bacterium]|nr:hypothetical protein [Holophagaceae bacterium]
MLKSCKKWISGSPHSALKTKIKQIPDSEFAFTLSEHNEHLEAKVYQDNKEHILGFKYYIVDTDQYEWTSYIVANQSDGHLYISIEIHCEANIATKDIPRPKSPHILRHLLKGSSGGADGPFNMSGRPKNLESIDVEMAAKIINGKFLNKMPIVYISSTYAGRHVLNVNHLAQRMYGMAHVFVEPDVHFGNRLALETNSTNPRLGAVGIFWPRGYGHEILRRDGDHDEFVGNIYDIVQTTLLMQRLDREVTWSYLEHKIHASTIANLRLNQVTKVPDEFIEAIDKELKSKDELLAIAEEEIEHLKSKIQKLSTRQSKITETATIISKGDETELYEGEYNDFVIELIKDKFESSLIGTRSRDLLKSLIDANKKVGNQEELELALKQVLSNWDGLTSRSRRSLEDLEYMIIEDGKHVKILFFGDSRYTATLPKTPSDFRSGRNCFSDARRVFF